MFSLVSLVQPCSDTCDQWWWDCAGACVHSLSHNILRIDQCHTSAATHGFIVSAVWLAEQRKAAFIEVSWEEHLVRR